MVKTIVTTSGAICECLSGSPASLASQRWGLGLLKNNFKKTQLQNTLTASFGLGCALNRRLKRLLRKLWPGQEDIILAVDMAEAAVPPAAVEVPHVVEGHDVEVAAPATKLAHGGQPSVPPAGTSTAWAPAQDGPLWPSWAPPFQQLTMVAVAAAALAPAQRPLRPSP